MGFWWSKRVSHFGNLFTIIYLHGVIFLLKVIICGHNARGIFSSLDHSGLDTVVFKIENNFKMYLIAGCTKFYFTFLLR